MKTLARTLALLVLSVGLYRCTAANQTIGLAVATNQTTPVSYDCTYYAGYNDLATCQSATASTCTSTFETYPNGGVGTCYFPPTGYAICQTSPPSWDWVYTVFTWCDTGSVDGSSNEIYNGTRSVVGCSSNVCTCGNAQVTTETCSGAECSLYTPDPTLATPTPPPCN